jgi:hypothetical protein
MSAASSYKVTMSIAEKTAFVTDVIASDKVAVFSKTY